MVIDILEIGLMEKSMGKVVIISLMVICMRDIGVKEREMDLVSISGIMERHSMESGLMIRLKNKILRINF